MGRKDKNIQDDGAGLVGSHMRLARQRKQISLKEMAEKVDYTVPYLSAVENGNARPSHQLVEIYERVLELEPGELMQSLEMVEQAAPSLKGGVPDSLPREDWGEAPDVPGFTGREQELSSLSRSILSDRCRIIAILGIGGVGKTSLAYKLAHQTKHQFDYIFWRSLQSMPRLDDLLKTCILFFSNRQETDLYRNEEDLITLLISYLQRRRCLLILDNFESVFVESHRMGQYINNYQGYGRLLRRIGESSHQSCLIVTSREKPRELASVEGPSPLARSFMLTGVGTREAQDILKEKNLFGSEEDWTDLVELYAGNPLSLKLISEPIREVFGGYIAAFLLQGEAVFGDIYDLLAQQIHRLSSWEREILYWLAIERVTLTLADLLKNIVLPVPKGALPEALASLQSRSMIEMPEPGGFTLHPVVMEYVTSEIVERAIEEIVKEDLAIFDTFALMKAQSKDYIRETQKRLILEPLANHLLARLGRRGSEEKLRSIVSQLQKVRREVPGYAGGNLLNLLVQLQIDLRGWNFSHLVIKQAYLRGVSLPEVDFSFADLGTTAFTETFGSILAVAFSNDGQILAAGTVTGEIRTWQVSGNTPSIMFQGHTNWVWSIAFSPDGQMLASGSDDRTVRLWRVSTGQMLNIFEGHKDRVRSVAFSPDGQTVASGSEDGTVRLWTVRTNKYFNIQEGQGGQVYAVAFSPDGRLLASASKDGAVRLWEVASGAYLMTLTGHTDRIYAVAFSPDGRILASSSEDETVRLWEAGTGECFAVLEGQGGQVYTIAFSSDGQTLASGSEDGAVRLWVVNTGQRLNTLKEHSNRVYSVAFSPGEQMLLASGSNDQTVRLWDIRAEKCLDALQGYTNLVWSIAFSKQGGLLVSGSNDQAVRLWNIETGACLATLQGHRGRVRSVAFSPGGQFLASGSEDRTVHVWEVGTGQVHFILGGHSDSVRSVAFSPDGQVLASGSEDGSVRLWEVSTGYCFRMLEDRGDQVYTVAFSPDGHMVASGSEDGKIRLWDVRSGRYSALVGHSDKIYAVAFSPDGSLLASGSNDQTVRLWEIHTGRCLATLEGHNNRIYALAFSPDGSLLASGSNDQTVRLWKVHTGQCFAILKGPNIWVYSVAFSPDGHILAIGGYEGTIAMWDVQAKDYLPPLKSEKPYERMNITGARSLMPSQRSMLKALGAIDTSGRTFADR